MSGIKKFVKSQFAAAIQVSKDSNVSRPIVYHFHIGNEAADADSIVSSFCYAYFNYLKIQNQPHLTDMSLHIPVVAIQRKELHLRREVQILLNKVNLDLNDLICIDEIKSLPVPPNDDSNIKLTLLDHNLMSSAISSTFLSPNRPHLNVHEILDHHKDMGAYTEITGERRNIAFAGESALVGSACTLVFEAFCPHNNTAATTTDEATTFCGSMMPMDVEVAVLLSGVIALDTLNMSPQAAKGTPRDARALAALQPVIAPRVPDLSAFFDELSNAKTDPSFWSELNASDCLLLDYKLFSVKNKNLTSSNSDNNSNNNDSSKKVFNIGMSSVSMSAELMLLKSDLVEACNQYLFSTDNKGETICDVLIIMCTAMDPSFARDLIIVAKSEARLLDLTAFLTGGASDGVNSAITATLSVDLKLSPLTTLATTTTAAAAADPECEKSVVNVEANFKLSGMYQVAYHQGNVKASRKQVAPLVSHYFENTILLKEIHVFA